LLLGVLLLVGLLAVAVAVTTTNVVKQKLTLLEQAVTLVVADKVLVHGTVTLQPTVFLTLVVVEVAALQTQTQTLIQDKMTQTFALVALVVQELLS
jgi:hypothetical protein